MLALPALISLFGNWEPRDWVALVGGVIGFAGLVYVARLNNRGRSEKEQDEKHNREIDQKQEDITGYRTEMQNMRDEMKAMREEMASLKFNYGLLFDFTLILRNDIRKLDPNGEVRDWPSNLKHLSGGG